MGFNSGFKGLIPKQALKYKPKGRRNRGLSRKRWREQLHLEDQGTGNTPDSSWTWWWWWWIFFLEFRRGDKIRPNSSQTLTTFQINHQPDATIFQFIIMTFIYSSTCFRPSRAHHQEFNDCSSSLWFYLRIVVTAVLCSWLAGPTTNTARLSPRYEGKTRGCYCSHWAPHDGQ